MNEERESNGGLIVTSVVLIAGGLFILFTTVGEVAAFAAGTLIAMGLAGVIGIVLARRSPSG